MSERELINTFVIHLLSFSRCCPPTKPIPSKWLTTKKFTSFLLTHDFLHFRYTKQRKSVRRENEKCLTLIWRFFTPHFYSMRSVRRMREMYNVQLLVEKNRKTCWVFKGESINFLEQFQQLFLFSNYTPPE